jgi:hypothetical protein
MRHLLFAGRLAAAVTLCAHYALAAPPARKALSANDEAALRTLIAAVDGAAQKHEPASDALTWDVHVLESVNHNGYLPFTVLLSGAAGSTRAPDALTSGMMYARAIPRREGRRVTDEHSVFFDWLTKSKGAPLSAAIHELVSMSPGDLPMGGPGVMSNRRSTSMASQNSAILGLREKEVEGGTARPDPRDPRLYPFEDYWVFDTSAADPSESPTVQGAFALPPGEYDVFVGLLDRTRRKDRRPALVLSRTVRIPAYTPGELTLGSPLVLEGIRALPEPFQGERQREHPYAFGDAEFLPRTSRTFAATDDLMVILQAYNYRAPASNLIVSYRFYSEADGKLVFFNQTEPMMLQDEDLPPAPTVQAFVLQSMPLQSFPPGPYVLEMTVEDRVSNVAQKATVEFSVRPPGP